MTWRHQQLTLFWSHFKTTDMHRYTITAFGTAWTDNSMVTWSQNNHKHHRDDGDLAQMRPNGVISHRPNVSDVLDVWSFRFGCASGDDDSNGWKWSKWFVFSIGAFIHKKIQMQQSKTICNNINLPQMANTIYSFSLPPQMPRIRIRSHLLPFHHHLLRRCLHLKRWILKLLCPLIGDGGSFWAAAFIPLLCWLWIVGCGVAGWLCGCRFWGVVGCVRIRGAIWWTGRWSGNKSKQLGHNNWPSSLAHDTTHNLWTGAFLQCSQVWVTVCGIEQVVHKHWPTNGLWSVSWKQGKQRLSALNPTSTCLPLSSSYGTSDGLDPHNLH